MFVHGAGHGVHERSANQVQRSGTVCSNDGVPVLKINQDGCQFSPGDRVQGAMAPWVNQVCGLSDGHISPSPMHWVAGPPAMRRADADGALMQRRPISASPVQLGEVPG